MTSKVELPSDYQKFIAISKYARWIPEENRRERWDETVDRYIRFFQGRFDTTDPESWWNTHRTTDGTNDLHPISDAVWDDLRSAILNLEVMPSMRSLMVAGPALDRDNVAGYNPIAGHMRVVTRELGNVPISYLNNTSQTVLNKDGRWVEAIFKSYGMQPIKQVRLTLNSNTSKYVECTGNHRWVLLDGTVKSTNELSKGDRIGFISAPRAEIDKDYYLGIKHGLVYGDGTAVKSCERIKGYHIRLCGKLSEQLDQFEGYPVTYPPSANGDPVVMMYDGFAATHSLKELPSIELEVESYLLGFIRGWIAADGSVSKGRVSLCTSGKGKEWLEGVSERLGLVIQNTYKQKAETNYGKRNQDSFVVHFFRSSCLEEDLLCSWKREAFKPLQSHYTVHSVSDTGYEQEVFCAEVPDTNTFVLEGGLVTGNCSAQAIKGRGKEVEVWNKEIEEAIGQPITLSLKNPIAFDEGMYILLCGTGLGFSVERQFIAHLPTVGKALSRRIYSRNNVNYPGVHKDELSFFDKRSNTIIVADSKYGWASGLRILITELYNGNKPSWDMSKIRPAGAPLKTFGGRASGPKALDELFTFITETFSKALGRKLNSVECHDICCKIGDAVVIGGVRRSACISLSNLSDNRMRLAKSGNWWEANGYRRLANNSVAYTEKPDTLSFIKEWSSLIESGSGERGIFNRVAAKKTAERTGRRDASYDFLTNPCGEISLRDQGLCNLSEVVVRKDDTYEDLKRKVELATILGTFQATLTNFVYLSPRWKENAEEEALLGVSFTGLMDHAILNGEIGPTPKFHETHRSLSDILVGLKETAIRTNKIWSKILRINQSASITCVKPSGTVSQLVDSSSGIHPRYSPYYIRTVRADNKDPLTIMMKDVGFPWEPDVMSSETTSVFSFPMKSPGHAVFRDDRTAIEQLEYWMIYKKYWTEHNPSITVYVKDDEWLEVGSWVYKNFDEISGIAFLPHSDHIYQQAPYQEISKEDYETWCSIMPVDVDWSLLSTYEKIDTTKSMQEYACTGSTCEIIDI